MEISLDKELVEKITSKVKEILGREQDISLEEDLATLGLDSMGSVGLIVDLEELFDIVIDDEELMFENFSTIQKIVDRVAGKLG